MLIDWEAWSAEAFARAAREHKPILLSITAAWCQACHEMDRTTYSDPAVAAAVHTRFVPVRIDTNQRPDVNERYNLGGWPTTAFLTPSGELLAGGTFVSRDRMAAVLRRVSDEYAARADVLANGHGAGEDRRGAADPPAGGTAPPSATSLVESVFSTYDEEFGGFGVEPKFPHTAPLHLGIALWRETELPRWRSMVERSLDAMALGGLYDARRGGYFRYAATRDWRLPHSEKLLETNAGILRACAEAALEFGRDVDRQRSAAIVEFLRGSLEAPGGGFYGSDADRILYADANAEATRALLAASVALDDPELGRGALMSFERVLLACYRPGEGVAHYFDGHACVRGLLSDQIAVVLALMDAYDLGAGEPYRMMAEELARFACGRMWDPSSGGLFDRVGADGDLGLLKQRRKPFAANAEAAAAFIRVARSGGDPELLEKAQGALAAAAAQLDGQGVDAAHYVLAVRMVDSFNSSDDQ